MAGVIGQPAGERAARGRHGGAAAPGDVETADIAALRAGPARSQAILDRIPAGRRGLPGDIGGAVMRLASPAASCILGAVLDVDGGWLAR